MSGESWQVARDVERRCREMGTPGAMRVAAEALALQAEILARAAEALGMKRESAEWREEAKRMLRAARKS